MARNEISDTNEAQKNPILNRLLMIGIPILIMVGFVVLSSIASSQKPVPSARKGNDPIIAVMGTMAVADDVQLTVTAQGESRPRIEIDLVPEVAGKITYVSPKFLSGGLFKKGDTLFRIDPADYDVAVVRAEAALARAKQILVRETAESEIARRDWADLGDGPASDLTLRKPQLLEAQAGVQSAEADVENAKTRLRRTYVRAPFDGRVREKFADIGQYVNPGSRLGRIFSTDFAEVRLALSDSDLLRLNLPVAYVAKSRAEALDVQLSAPIAGQIRSWTGKIMRTDSVFDTQTRSLFAIAEVADPYGAGASSDGFPLTPGLFVDAQLPGKAVENVIIIPRGGLRPNDKVYVMDTQGKAEIRAADVVDSTAERAVLRSGVAAGELVIVSALEPSSVSGSFKMLDVDDPEKILAAPPKPEKEEKPDAATALAAEKKKLNKLKAELAAQAKAVKTAEKRAKAEAKSSGKKKKKKKDDDARGGDEAPNAVSGE